MRTTKTIRSTPCTLKVSKGKDLHSYDTIIVVACDMEPCTWVDKSGIPTLQNIVRIF